ncbi:MAG: helix-hairpin-helix domain-containing protein [Thermodesulfobacteriota bacterium]|nr:helix-hairpin-helix domain-containing protein [Thermodesulfobacteriota bacterium]
MKRWKSFFGLVIIITMMMALAPVVLAQDVVKININKASVEELKQLEKVGQKYAERIVEHRTDNGPFKKPEDIMEVKGIGPKTFELNKDRITVE